MLYLSVLGFLLFLFVAIACWIIAAILSTVLEISILDMWWSHWWLHLGPSNKNQYSQRFWAAITLVPFIYAMKPHVICKGTSEEHAKHASLQRRERSAESEFNGCVFDAFWQEWSLNSCKLQICNNFFWFWKKLLRDTRANLLVAYSNKIHMHIWHFSSYARPLKICEVCNFCAITDSLYERFVDRILNSVLSTLSDNPRDSRFWTVSPGLQIRVWYLPDNRQSCYFL